MATHTVGGSVLANGDTINLQGKHGGSWFFVKFPDGRILSVGTTPDRYDIADGLGRVLLSVERDRDVGKPGWGNVFVTWPVDDRFVGQNPPVASGDGGTEPAPTPNDHYGRLNARFDIRAAALRNLGFAYQHVPGLNTAVFTRTRFGRVHSIASGTAINADDVVWADTLAQAERFVA